MAKKVHLAFTAALALANTLPALAFEPVAPESPPEYVYPIGFPPTYAPRVLATVYSNGGPAGSAANVVVDSTTVHWADDIDFAGGPWERASTRRLSVISVWVQKGGSNCVGTTTFDMLYTIYDASAFDFASNPMPRAAPITSGRVPVVNSMCGVQTTLIIDLTGLPGGGVLLPSSRIILEIALVHPGTDTLRPVGTAQTEFPVLCTPITTVVDGGVGRSTPSFANDFNSDGILAGGPVVDGLGNGPIEHRRFEVAGVSGVYRHSRLRLRGDVVVAPPANPIPIGCIADAGLTRTSALTAGGVLWYSLCLNGAATDAARQFFDLDSEGSALGDAAMALYRADGTLAGLDNDDGSGTNAALTFGICRRPATGDGLPFDGRDGELTAGNYFLAVSAGGASFSSGFTVNNPTTVSGNITLNIRTNTNGAPLAPSVPPALMPDGDFGELMPPGRQSAPSAVPNGLAWYRFVSGAATNPSGYVDIHDFGSAAAADTLIAVYNAAGNLVASDDDDGPGFLAQLSFGTTDPRPANGDGEPFDGRDGPLPGGTYYVALMLFPGAAPGNDRWCARSGSTSNFPLQLNILTNVVGTPRCVADVDDGTFTGTPDGGVTIDDLLYYLDGFSQGLVRADVDDGTFTGTPDGGVTIDDLLYFVFRFSEGC